MLKEHVVCCYEYLNIVDDNYVIKSVGVSHYFGALGVGGEGSIIMFKSLFSPGFLSLAPFQAVRGRDDIAR